MTVLVQEMIDARVAGVLFTTNPVSGSWSEMVVEAVWGLGEQLVSGAVVPDRYVLSRDRRLGNRKSPTVVLEEVRAQRTQQVLDHGTLKTCATEAPNARKLLRDDLVALGELGLLIEGKRGAPQDIEWVQDRAGVVHVLQARPITTQQRLPRGEATLWTRRFIGERFPGGVTPLTWSLVGPALDYFIAYPDTSRVYLGGDPPFQVVNGHPYANVTVFRHLAFKLPGAAPPRFMLDFFPPEEEQRWLGRRAALPDLAVYASIFRTTFKERRWRRFRWNPLTNVRAWDAFRSSLPAALAPLETASAGAALAHTDTILRAYIKIHVTSLLFANILWELLSPGLTEAQRGLILRPWGGSITRKVDVALGEVGRGSRTLESFLLEHGHRSRSSWEIWAPRLAEDPAGTLKLAAGLAAADPPDIEGEARETAAAVAQLRADHRKLAHLGSEYFRLREEQRYYLDLIFWRLKQRLCVLAPELGLAEADIPWLSVSELGDPPVDGRRRAALRCAIPPDPAPPDFLRGDQPVAPPSSRTRLQGLGVSPGTARGTARVLTRYDDAPMLRAGEILVTPSTDPAWTPLYARAAGLVLELGSQLSHGAVVAREYRIPAVANVMGATRRLRTGDELMIDGQSGTVWVLASAPVNDDGDSASDPR
jgi:pyruvate,water dikinase